MESPASLSGDVEQLQLQARRFLEVVRENFEEFNVIVGVPYEGIPIATAMAMLAGVRFAYCREEPKDHGEKASILGSAIRPEDKVLLVSHVLDGDAERKVLQLLVANGNPEIVGILADDATSEEVERFSKEYGLPVQFS